MGKYVDSNLTSGENVVYEAKNHWIAFVTLRSLFTLGILPLLESKSDEYAVTNKRVIIKVGIFSRKTLEMNLSKIESIGVDQGILGKILGYGSIRITGTGATKETFYKVGSPMELKRAVDKQLHV
jgi:uncharacterized membrane protein YdbT with pleckstrin-like domain